MNPLIRFTVYGKPEPQGSARAFMRPGTKFPVVTSDNPKNKPWRQQVTGTAIAEAEQLGLARPMIPKGQGARLDIEFFFPPLAAKKKPLFKTTNPDIDKLVRSVCDALTGVAYSNDSQVCYCVVGKYYGEPSRVEIAISQIDPRGERA